jgi:hypothetical protein
MVLTILPGTRLLPMTGLSQINRELEFLLNTDSKMLIRASNIVPKVPTSNICTRTLETQLRVTDVIIG